MEAVFADILQLELVLKYNEPCHLKSHLPALPHTQIIMVLSDKSEKFTSFAEAAYLKQVGSVLDKEFGPHQIMDIVLLLALH